MKHIIPIIVFSLITITTDAQVKLPAKPSGFGIPVHTDKKLYIKDGKVSDTPSKMVKDKALGVIERYYEDYYNVELNGYGFGDDNQVPRFYWEMQDSSYTHVGTAFTHYFDWSTFDFFGFSNFNVSLVDFIVIDSIAFNFGHVNHSGLDNTLGVSLRQLPHSDKPATNGTVLWTDTTMSNNFTDSLDLNVLPTFSIAVAETLATRGRGVFLELFFDGETFLDTGSFLANYWSSPSQCPPGFPWGVNESFTYRDHGLTEGRSYFQNPQQSIGLGIPPNSYNSNLDLYVDCNGNNVYDTGQTEAIYVQNISMGIWYSVYLNVGVNELNQDLSALNQNYPNPFNTTSTIEYTLVRSSEVAIEVFDITGKSVLFVNEGSKTAGSHQVVLNGNELNNGIYYYTFITNSGRVTKKMIVQH